MKKKALEIKKFDRGILWRLLNENELLINEFGLRRFAHRGFMVFNQPNFEKLHDIEVANTRFEKQNFDNPCREIMRPDQVYQQATAKK